MSFSPWRPCVVAGLLSISALAQAPVATPSPASPPSSATPLRLVYGTFDPAVSRPEVPPALRAAEDVDLWVVQLRDRPTDAMRAAIRGAGGEIHSYLPTYAYVVRMDEAAAVAVHGLSDVRWLGRYEPAWRLEPALVMEHLKGVHVPMRRYNIVVVDKHQDKPALGAAIERIGGRVVSEHVGGLLFTVDLDGVGLLQAARLDQVLWIDRWSAPEDDMDNARIQGGGVHVEQAGGFRGQGVRGHVYEGLEASHPDFTTTPVSVNSCGSAASHGHCTAGIVFGNGSSDPNARGMAPDAAAYYTTYNCVTAGFSRWLVIQDVVNTHECLFTTASWGNARTTQYTSISADSDDIVFDHDIPWTQSQSNAGSQQSRPQAWAKNVISIGAVQHFDDSNPGNDSWRASNASIGPAADGRIKPDLCAYYDAILCSDLSGTAGYTNGSTTPSFGGTSGATPIVAGHNAIALQMFTDGIFGNTLRVPGGTRFQNRPHFTTLKALMVAGAAQYAFNSGSSDNLRNHQGWGFPDLAKLYDTRAQTFLVDEAHTLRQGQSRSYTIRVAANEPELKVVMSFSDPPGNPAAAIHAINDLSIKVTDPNGTIYWGNHGLDAGNWSTTGGSANTVDTVECVFVQNPVVGDWAVDVIATLVAADSHIETTVVDADYGLAVVGAIGIGGGTSGGSCIENFMAGDGDPSTGSCNNVPFGTTAGSPLANQRYQVVMRASDLGAATAKFLGLAFAPCGNGLRTHDTITVRLSHVPVGHTLATSFATNLPSPVTVLSAHDFSWPSAAGSWAEIGLQAPFHYDGQSDVVVDITLTGSDFTGATPEFRRGSDPRLSAAGWTGSPPPTGSLVPVGALKMRLSEGCASVVPFGRGCSTLSMAANGAPILGRNFDVVLTGATPGVPSFLNFGLTNAGPLFPLDLGLVGLPGCLIYHDPIVGVSVPTDASGHSSLTLTAPGTTSLVGARLFVSGAQLDAAHPNSAATSDYLRIVFGY